MTDVTGNHLKGEREPHATPIVIIGATGLSRTLDMQTTIVPPFNTTIAKGYNALTGAKVKLGRWDEYLAMRRGIFALNAAYRGLLSNDLGAVGGWLFDVGSGRYPAPPLGDARVPGPRARRASPGCARKVPKQPRRLPRRGSRTLPTPRSRAGYATLACRSATTFESHRTTATVRLAVAG